MIKDEYFEGDYRRKPSQNFSGVRKNEKIIEFIDKLKHERKKRETSKTEVEKAIIIQAIFRGQVCRKNVKHQMKNELNNKIKELSEKDLRNVHFHLNDIRYLLSRLQLIYPRKIFSSIGVIQENTDYDHIRYIAHAVYKHQEAVNVAVSKDIHWLWRINYLFSLYMYLINSCQDTFDETILTFLDTMKSFIDTSINIKSELFDDDSKIIIEKLLSNGLFKNLIMMLENISTIPPHLCTNLTTHIHDLFKSIFQSMSSTKNVNFLNVSMKLLAEDVLCKDLSPEAKRLVFLTLKEVETFPILAVCEIICNYDDKNLYSIHTLQNFLIYFEREKFLKSNNEQRAYFQLLSKLTMSIPLLGNCIHPVDDKTDESDSDSDDKEQCVLNDCLDLINSTERTDKWNSALLAMITRKDYDGFFWFCKCLYHVWLHDPSSPIYKYMLIRKVGFQPSFLKVLWSYINRQKRILSLSSQLLSVTVLSMLSAGVFITAEEADKVVPTMTIFCVLLKNYMALSSDETLLNEDLFPEAGHPIAFPLNEVVTICNTFKEVAIGIISLAFPSISFEGITKRIDFSTPTRHLQLNSLEWKTLLEQIVSLLKSLYDRDCRQQFTDDPSFWLSGAMEDSYQLFSHFRGCENISPFSSNISSVPQNTSKPFTVFECRYLTAIRTLPFTVSFLKRFSLYQKYIDEDKQQFQDPHMHFFNVSNIFLGIRRDYLYEDTFERLFLEPEIKKQIRVNLVSAIGIEEQGIDGGGLFREFILEFLKTAFDPNRGFFILNRDNEFYPNPNINVICKDFQTHYKFIGKMLGKALFENIVVEVTLADFFLTEILGFYDEFYINGLANLDPDLFKNLISLTCYDGNLSELGLDFTLTLNDFGENKVVELKPNGKDIPVNEENVLEYIYLVAKYKVHMQIEEQTSSFSEGLDSVVSLEWLRIFTAKELQIIISGNKCPIDIDDMKAHTVYTGNHAENHPTIKMFWNVVKSLDNKQRSLLLRFVTSCSRPPLLGFKELYPPFCIQLIDSDDNRLPTSSTCMNMLKLPMFTNESIMKKRIIYAIQSRSGFDLA